MLPHTLRKEFRPMALGQVTPILRMFDEVKAREFYIEFLGFKAKFEHRFEDNFPLYMAIERDGCEIHLSEHHGDSTPGSAIRIETTSVEELQNELAIKNYKYNRPGIERQPWGHEMSVTDPFGNRLTFTSMNNG